MRIQVVFNSTPILVPCGDGNLTVGELIQKAILRYKKVVDKVEGERVESRGAGGVVGEGASLSVSVENIDVDRADNGVDEEEGERGEREDDGHLSHLPNPDASQDTELVATGPVWEPGEEGGVRGEGSQEPESPHLTPRKTAWSQVDSGYAPKSQESFSHSQPKSLEAYSTSQELSLQEGVPLSGGAADFSRDYSSLTPSQSETTPKRTGVTPEKKEELGGARSGPQRVNQDLAGSARGRLGSGSYVRVQRGNEGMLGMSPARSSTVGRHQGDFAGFGPGYERLPRPGDPRVGRDHYGGYPGGYREGYSHYGDHDGYLRGHDFERPSYPHLDWRRSIAGGEFDHVSPYGGRGMYGEMYHHPGARFDPHHPHHRGPGMGGGRLGSRRDRLLMEEARLLRAKSHERMEHMGMGGAQRGLRPEEEYREPPMEFYLSQPTTPHFPYERPVSFNMPPPPANFLHPGGFDPRQTIGGPSGYSLSQPAAFLGPRSMHGPSLDHDRMRLVPLMERDPRGLTQRLRGAGGDDRRDRTYSLDDEYEDDDDLDRKDQRGSQTQLNPFKRDFRKSIFRDGHVFSNWMEKLYEDGLEYEEDQNNVPMFEGDVSQSQRTPSPQPPDEKERGDEESEDEEYGNVHIIELHKGDEALGIHLTHFTGPDGTDLGVFIGAMDDTGFAVRSEKLKINDRILACNGVDFTKEPYRDQVEEIFLEMVAKEPLLRMAVSRGLTLSLENLDHAPAEEEEEEERDGQREARETRAAEGVSEGSLRGEGGGKAREGASERKPDTATLAPSNTVTNTRLIGVKHTIHLTKGSRGYGFGIASRDVTTNDRSTPIYVKGIAHEGAAFQDGRLKIGDRILEVNGQEVEGLTQPEVVQLLRDSDGSVTLLISRQEVVEKHEESEFPFSSSSAVSSSAEATPTKEPTTVGKTVLNMEIPLYDSGPAGLGVTVFGRSTLGPAQRRGDMGIFIKSVVPGGAAALDGRLSRGDQLLAINSQSLLGRSNAEALDTLRKALTMATDSGSKIKLVIARKTGSNKKQPGMAALEESPIEDEAERAGETGTTEVGIDIGVEASQASQTSQTGQTGQTSQASQASQTSQTIQTSQASQSSQTSQSGSAEAGERKRSQQTGSGADYEASQSSVDLEPRRGILRHSTESPSHSPKASSSATGHTYKSHTLPGYSPTTTKRPSPSLTRRTQKPSTSSAAASSSQLPSPKLHKTYLPLKQGSPTSGRRLVSASGSLLGSGEFDRLEPKLESTDTGPSGYGGSGPPGYGVSGPPGYGGPGPQGYGVSGFHYGGWTEGEMAGIQRTASLSSDLSSVLSSQYHPRYPHFGMYPSHPHMSPGFPPSHPHFLSSHPGNLDAMATGHPHSMHSRLHNGTYDRQFSDGYNIRGNDMGHPHGYDSSSLRRQLESHSSDHLSLSHPGYEGGPSVSFSSITLSREQAPIRGSGRKEKPRGVLAVDGGSSSEQSDIYNHNSRSTSHTRSATPPPPHEEEEEEEEEEVGSLNDLRLSDSELSSFRRDDKGRISITKKTKKNPRQDFAHLTLSNTVPLMEGEAGLYRTGSDSCLPEAVEREEPGLLAGVEVGPSLGMVKSSSLESLHNMVSHSIKRDVKGAGPRGVARAPVIAPSFSQPAHSGIVPIPAFPGGRRDNAAVISFTKNPAAAKNKPQKKSIFKKVFKKKKSSKGKSSGKDKSGASPNTDYDTQSLEGGIEEERERERRTANSPDGYDSNDEILATIAKV